MENRFFPNPGTSKAFEDVTEVPPSIWRTVPEPTDGMGAADLLATWIIGPFVLFLLENDVALENICLAAPVSPIMSPHESPVDDDALMADA